MTDPSKTIKATQASINPKIQATKNSSDGTLYINRRGAGTSIGGTSSLTLMEISA